MTVVALPQSQEVPAEKIGLRGAQAMLTIRKVNPDWAIGAGRVRAQPRTVLDALSDGGLQPTYAGSGGAVALERRPAVLPAFEPRPESAIFVS